MKNDLNLYNDKYDASRSMKDYLIWLIQTGQAEILQGRNNIHTYNPFSQKHSSDTSILTPEECLRVLQSDRDRYTFQCKFQDKVYDISFGDSASYYYRGECGGLKESGEYYLPETEIPRYTAPKIGTKIIKVDEENYIVADRKEVYTQLSGEPIF